MHYRYHKENHDRVIETEKKSENESVIKSLRKYPKRQQHWTERSNLCRSKSSQTQNWTQTEKKKKINEKGYLKNK